MRPIGIPDAEWSVGYERTFTVTGLPLVGAWGGYRRLRQPGAWGAHTARYLFSQAKACW